MALNANVSYAYDSDTDNNQAFTNYYVAPKQLDFDVHFTKSLVGRPLNNEEFQFTMKNADGEVIATGTNNATGQINFNFIEGKRPTYTNADAGKTFTYTVEEVPSNLPNINSDSMKAIVTVNITKDLHVLTATSIAPEILNSTIHLFLQHHRHLYSNLKNLIYQWKNMILQQINY